VAYFTSVERLPAEVQDLIARRRRERLTIRAIEQELLEHGIRVPKSTLARHTQQLDAAERVTERSGLAPVLAELIHIRAALEGIADYLKGGKPNT
jgi:hypothetical protein